MTEAHRDPTRSDKTDARTTLELAVLHTIDEGDQPPDVLARRVIDTLFSEEMRWAVDQHLAACTSDDETLVSELQPIPEIEQKMELKADRASHWFRVGDGGAANRHLGWHQALHWVLDCDSDCYVPPEHEVMSDDGE